MLCAVPFRIATRLTGKSLSQRSKQIRNRYHGCNITLLEVLFTARCDGASAVRKRPQGRYKDREKTSLPIRGLAPLRIRCHGVDFALCLLHVLFWPRSQSSL